MLRSVMCVLAAALLSSACTSTIRSQEGAACSTNSSDDPQLVCSPAQDLVCITTYTRVVTNPSAASKYDGGIRHVYVCRMACNTPQDCPQTGDVCCRGDIYGKTYGKTGGCVPPGTCEGMGNSVSPDGGEPVAQPDGARDGGATDGAAEAGPRDAPADAGTPDAPADGAAAANG
jgi:hypothetical protein